jgi:predicted glycoside hydrolase/deacetylase ChbG (UPF0249 family)
MRIELHADDFGASKNVNRNIVAAWLADGLDGISVIANGDDVDGAAKTVNKNLEKALRIVVHLNLSEGFPIASPQRVPCLIDESGRLTGGFIGIWIKWFFSCENARRSLLHQIEIEWREQIKKVLRTFPPRRVSGLDGHVHIHMLPFLFPIAVKLAREFGLKEIRISRERFHYCKKQSKKFGFFVNLIKHTLLNTLAVQARKTTRKYSISSPDSVAGILYSGFMTSDAAESAITVANREKFSWLEIIFHPGRAKQEEFHRWGNNYAIGKFYLDPQRDREKDVLLTIKEDLSQMI